MNRILRNIFIAALLIVLSFSAFAQTKKKRTPRTVKPVTVQQRTVEPTQDVPVQKAAKKNERPGTSEVPASGIADKKTTSVPEFYYEFSQPDFPISKIVIEHDASGKGTISFKKASLDEEMSDPLTVSPAALERINNALAALSFLDSTENYQYERDYPHLGNVTIRIRRGGRDRTVKFNWTENKNAKVLYDEYRKLANQYIWIFDIAVARENQPLDAPRLMDSLDLSIGRGEISDPAQMVPLLRSLTDDERIPLIARNHAEKLIKRIEKVKK